MYFNMNGAFFFAHANIGIFLYPLLGDILFSSSPVHHKSLNPQLLESPTC